MSISDERLAELIKSRVSFAKACRATGSPLAGEEADQIAAALRELQQWRSGVHPQTGAMVGCLVVREPWTDESD